MRTTRGLLRMAGPAMVCLAILVAPVPSVRAQEGQQGQAGTGDQKVESVFLENELVSHSTPSDINVRTDEFYALRVEKLGFEPLTKNITPDDNATELELRLDEEKQPMGYLWIDTNSVGDVWLDGQNTGLTAPTLGLRRPIGRHVAELRDSSGGRSKPLNVKLVLGESLHVTLDISVRK